MKRIILLLALLPLLATAQKNLQGLMNAERKFAVASEKQGARKAFLGAADSAKGIVFDKGNPVMAQAYWSARKSFSGLLNWHPDAGEVSADGGFGYTTGPWTYKHNPPERPSASGRFITVWHFVNKEWKFLADIGTDNVLAFPLKFTPKSRSKSTYPFDTTLLLDAENDFNKIFTTGPAAAYQHYLSASSIVNRNSADPATTTDRNKLIAATPTSLRLENLGFGLAPTGDMAYTYGRTTLNEKTNSYLRIWHREPQGWKIIVDVLLF